MLDKLISFVLARPVDNVPNSKAYGLQYHPLSLLDADTSSHKLCQLHPCSVRTITTEYTGGGIEHTVTTKYTHNGMFAATSGHDNSATSPFISTFLGSTPLHDHKKPFSDYATHSDQVMPNHNDTLPANNHLNSPSANVCYTPMVIDVSPRSVGIRDVETTVIEVDASPRLRAYAIQRSF